MKNREKKLENFDFLKKKKIFHDESFSRSILRIITKFQQNGSKTKKKSSNLGRPPLYLLKNIFIHFIFLLYHYFMSSYYVRVGYKNLKNNFKMELMCTLL